MASLMSVWGVKDSCTKYLLLASIFLSMLASVQEDYPKTQRALLMEAASKDSDSLHHSSAGDR